MKMNEQGTTSLLPTNLTYFCSHLLWCYDFLVFFFSPFDIVLIDNPTLFSVFCPLLEPFLLTSSDRLLELWQGLRVMQDPSTDMMYLKRFEVFGASSLFVWAQLFALVGPCGVSWNPTAMVTQSKCR